MIFFSFLSFLKKNELFAPERPIDRASESPGGRDALTYVVLNLPTWASRQTHLSPLVLHQLGQK